MLKDLYETQGYVTVPGALNEADCEQPAALPEGLDDWTVDP